MLSNKTTKTKSSYSQNSQNNTNKVKKIKVEKHSTSIRYNTAHSEHNIAIVQEQLKYYGMYFTDDYLIQCVNIPQGSLFSQQMEILGDSLLNYFSVKYIYETYGTDFKEGQMTRLKIMLINRISLSILSQKLQLNLLCSNKHSTYLLSSLTEAIFGGFSLITNIKNVEKSFIHLLTDCFNQIISHKLNMDYKSALQSLTQKYYKLMPIYNTIVYNNIKESFITICQLGNIVTKAISNNKKNAEQKAAKIMMYYLNIDFKNHFLFEY